MADDIEEISSSDTAMQETVEERQERRALRSEQRTRTRQKSRSAFETSDANDSDAMEMKAHQQRRARRASWMDDETADAEIARVFEQDQSGGGGGTTAETTDEQLSQSGEKLFSPSHSRNSSYQNAQGEGGGSRPGTGTGHVDLSSSMRQRIRQQAKTAVEKKRGAVQLTKRLQRRMSTMRLDSTFDARDEETKVAEALERSKLLSQRVRRQPVGHIAQLPSAQEQYDFFTQVYAQTPAPHIVVEELIAAESADVTTRLITEKIDQPLVRFIRADKVPHHEQISRENALYFSPSRLHASAQLETGGDLRRLEEEGLYVGPTIRDRNLNALEQRLMKEPNEGRDWLGDDGRLLGIEGSGLASFPLKPDVDDGDDLVVYVKAMKGRQASTNGIYQLDIDVSKMLFTHHPLFNNENILAMRLLQLYRNYLRRSEEKLAVYYDQRLGAVKQAIVQFEYLMRTTEEANSEEMKSRLKILKEEVKELRKSRNNEEMMDRKLLHQIVETWRHLRDVRQAQGFITTAFQLLLKQKAVDFEQERLLRDADLKAELLEREEEFEEWALTQGDNPPRFDREAVWNAVVSAAETTRRQPDEPLYIPLLTNDAIITPNDQCPAEEKERRADVEKHKFILNIYFNDLEVCKSAPRTMNADFCVTFGQIYSLQVYEWPQSIKIIILEKSVRGDYEQVACIGVPVPSMSQVSNMDNAQDEIEFSSERTVSRWKNAVGSGEVVSFPVSGVQSFIPRTTGVLQCCALWGRDKSGIPLVPPSHAQNDALTAMQEIDPKNMAAVRELQQLLQKSKFDPNDPVNAQFLSVLKDIEWYGKTATEQQMGGGSQLDCFRLVLEECRLVSDEEFDNDVRFKLLQLRRDQVPEFRSTKMVPAYSNEIDPQIFQRYEKRIERERQGATVTGIDSLRAAGNRYATLIRAQVMERFSKAEKRKTYSDIVREDPIPSFFGALGSLLGPEDTSRKLKPFRKSTLRHGVVGKDVKILVNVQSGSNLPTRNTPESRDQTTASVYIPKVEPFVQVWFQEASARTSVVEGKNPNWQQMLLLDFKPPNEDFSQDSLKTITDIIYLNVYDQVVSKLPSDNREQANTVHEQVEKRWLGNIEIPFSTLYWNGKIEGALRVRTPPVYLGYSLGSQAETTVHPYIKLLIAIEPALPRPEALTGVEFESVESDQIVTLCRRWNKVLDTVFPDRRFISLVTDTHGRTVLASRFLRPIKPPSEVEAAYQQSPRKGADLACRIVALIPFVSDPLMFPGVCDVWSTCDEFLRMLCGDEEEHCVLLWCWLAGLGINCAVLLGNGLPEGPRAAYVLANFVDGTKILYNANDGQAYDVRDAFCPLHSVGTLVVADNVYGNVQQHEHPSHMRFEFDKIKDWRPIFSRNSPSPGLEPVQPHTLEYVATDPMSVMELRGNLEREIKHRFDEWRVHGIPQWNFHAAKTLRDLLPLMEEKSLTDEVHTEGLKTLTDSYKMCGVPLHMHYEQVDKVVEAVKATNVHVNFNRDVEFALAVYIHPYTNNILSCWVYIASLIRLR